jgi:hypothetical protein
MIGHSRPIELVKAANANLRRIEEGFYRQQQERESVSKAFEREQREERARKRKLLKALRDELKQHHRDWDFLYELEDLSGTVADLGVADSVVLEEVDSQRERLIERINKLELELL